MVGNFESHETASGGSLSVVFHIVLIFRTTGSRDRPNISRQSSNLGICDTIYEDADCSTTVVKVAEV